MVLEANVTLNRSAPLLRRALYRFFDEALKYFLLTSPFIHFSRAFNYEAHNGAQLEQSSYHGPTKVVEIQVREED